MFVINNFIFISSITIGTIGAIFYFNKIDKILANK